MSESRLPTIVQFMTPALPLFLRTNLILTPEMAKKVKYYVFLHQDLKDMIMYQSPYIEYRYFDVPYDKAGNIINVVHICQAISQTGIPVDALYLTMYYEATPDAVKLINQNLNIKKIFFLDHAVRFGPFKEKFSIASSVQIIAGSKFNYTYLQSKNDIPLLKINGIPQFDYILDNLDEIKTTKRQKMINRFGIPTNKKLVLVIGWSIVNIHVDHYLLELLAKKFPNHHFILKPKDLKYIRDESTILDIPDNVSYLESTDFIYDFLGCDINIVVRGGISFLESLLINPNSILYQTYNLDDTFDYQGYHTLNIARSDSQIISQIQNMINNNYQVDNKYLSEVKQYTRDILGGDIKSHIGDQLAQLMIDNL